MKVEGVGFLWRVRGEFWDFIFQGRVYEIQVFSDFVVVRDAYGQLRKFPTLQTALGWLFL